MECCQVFDGSCAADHDHGLGGAGYREFLELAGPTLRKTLFSGFPHGGNRSFGLLLLFRRNTGFARGSLTACANGVFPKPCAHSYLTLQPTRHGERQDHKSNS